ncbi:MAG: hypothetical protein ACPG6B_09985, partial [Oceanihabitans sp.]
LNASLVLFLVFVSVTSFAQDLPPNLKPGKCYIRYLQEDKSINWLTMNCELLKKYMEHSLDSNKLKTLQIKLSNFGYHVDVSGKTDIKTITAFKKYKKDKKKRLRKARRKK